MNQGFEYREQVGPRQAGRSVLEHLARSHRHSSAETWRTRLEAGELSLDGVARGVELLRPGQWLAWRRPPWEEPPAPLAFAILHRDEQLLAVAKPRGLPTVPNGGFLEHTLLRRVERCTPRPRPCTAWAGHLGAAALRARRPGAPAPGRRLARGASPRSTWRWCEGGPRRSSSASTRPSGPCPTPSWGGARRGPGRRARAVASPSGPSGRVARWSACASRPGGRTRSASTWPPRATRWWA